MTIRKMHCSLPIFVVTWWLGKMLLGAYCLYGYDSKPLDVVCDPTHGHKINIFFLFPL